MTDAAPTPSPLKRLGVELALGAVLGFVGASAGGPTLISWWYEPPSKDAFSCAGSVRTALSQFVTMQLVCAAVGGAVLAIILFFSRRALQKRDAAKSPTGP
jgi:hypothetical protein